MMETNNQVEVYVDDESSSIDSNDAFMFDYFDYLIVKELDLYVIKHNGQELFTPLTSFTSAFAVVYHLHSGEYDKLTNILHSVYKYEKHKNDMCFYKHCRRWDMYENARISAICHLRKIRDSIPEKI